MELISICVSDIPKDRIKQFENGKKYLNIVVSERKEPDKYGNNLKVIIAQTKEERAANANKIYIGNGKTVEYKSNTVKTPEDVENLPQAEDIDDLPF
jgi:hypothetical protein